MRIDRLDLTRYGRFTDAILPLGAPERGRPDLHIVYGDNEAGKTTTLNALLDLLFGIEASSPYAFLHQATAMRLGGALEIGGDNREVIRLPKSMLLDADERPLPEGLFSQDLAGLDRATFRTMFSLDEKTLAAGGESILASQGDLGQLLFSATAGLADFAKALGKLRLETEAFYKLHGRKHEFAELKKRLLALKEQRTAIDVAAAPYARLIAVRDGARASYDEAVSLRGRLQAELDSVRWHLMTLPRLAEWRNLRSEFDALPAVASVPAGWPEEAAELQRTLVSLAARRAASEEEVGRLSAEIEALPIDEAGLAIADRARAASPLRERHATAAKDLPDRRARLQAAEGEVARILADLGHASCATPRDLMLRPGIAQRVRQCLEGLSGVASAVEDARHQLRDTEARCVAAAAALDTTGALPEEAPALSELRGALAGAEADDSGSRLRLAKRSCKLHGDALAERLAALAPWHGDAHALAALDLPEQAERDDLARGLTEATSRRGRLLSDLDQLRREVHRHNEARKALLGGSALIDDEAAADSRAAREAAWTAHLANGDGDSAMAFEKAMRADDAVIDARFAQADALTQLRSVDRSLTLATVEFEDLDLQLGAVNEAWAKAERRIAERLGPFVGINRVAPLAAFDAFLARRERALDAREMLRAAEVDRGFAKAEAAATRDRLIRALSSIGTRAAEDWTTDVLVCAVRAFLDGQGAARALKSRRDDLVRDVEDRKRQVERAERGYAAWEAGWLSALHPTWLAATPDVGLVRDALGALAELGPALDKRDELADRVRKMEATQVAFATEIRALAACVGCEGSDVLELADRIEARAAAASATAASRAGKVRDRDAAKDRLALLAPAFDGAARRVAEMTGRFAVGTLDDLALAFESARRREDLGRRIGALEAEICDACGTSDPEKAEERLAAADRGCLERRRAELETLCEDHVELTQERFAALGRAAEAVEAIDGDAAAARLDEERRTVLLEIEDRTMAHLTMRAGIIAAENAIALYRDRHRSSMMAQASDLFATLSRGAYSGLAAQSAKDGEILVGLPTGGGSKLSTEMSTATRNQLYLALRIAAYREFVKTRRPVPFVLDDVLETFDDDRAEASLTLLAEMARTGQVIYLTHHRHLCAIARRVCPEATLHDLGTFGCGGQREA